MGIRRICLSSDQMSLPSRIPIPIFALPGKERLYQLPCTNAHRHPHPSLLLPFTSPINPLVLLRPQTHYAVLRHMSRLSEPLLVTPHHLRPVRPKQTRSIYLVDRGLQIPSRPTRRPPYLHHPQHHPLPLVSFPYDKSTGHRPDFLRTIP